MENVKTILHVTQEEKRRRLEPLDVGKRLQQLPPAPQEETEQKYPEGPRGMQPGTSDQVTPLKHVMMYRRSFTSDNLKEAVQYILTEGAEGQPPLFLTLDTRGTWSVKENRLCWQADDNSTGLLEVVPQDDMDAFLKKAFYQQDLPSGIVSLHKHLSKSYLGISRNQCKAYIQKQNPWQLLAPKRDKAKYRVSQLARRPFTHVEIDCLIILL